MKQRLNNTPKGVKGAIKIPLEIRFWHYVDKRGDDECWPWLGTFSGKPPQKNYGSIYVDGRSRRATQVSWEICHGVPFPPGKMACHKCDNPPCVNPRHIWPGTMSENIRDSIAKGRMKPVPPRTRWKTHCRRGHEFNEENSIVGPGGARQCRACRRAWDAGRRKRAREALAKYGKGGASG